LKIIDDLWRYGEAQTSLFMAEAVIEEDWGVRVYGHHVMGGRTGANLEDLQPATEEDWGQWVACERFRRGRKVRHGA